MWGGGWDKCLTSVVSLRSAFLCVDMIKRLQGFSHSFEINMQIIGEGRVLLYLLPKPSRAEWGCQLFSRSCLRTNSINFHFYPLNL